MCTVLLSPGGYPIAVNKYIISYISKTDNHHQTTNILYQIVQFYAVWFIITVVTLIFMDPCIVVWGFPPSLDNGRSPQGYINQRV